MTDWTDAPLVDGVAGVSADAVHTGVDTLSVDGVAGVSAVAVRTRVGTPLVGGVMSVSAAARHTCGVRTTVAAVAACTDTRKVIRQTYANVNSSTSGQPSGDDYVTVDGELHTSRLVPTISFLP